MHFLQDMAVCCLKLLTKQRKPFIEYVTRKQMDTLTLKANQLYSNEPYILLFSFDP